MNLAAGWAGELAVRHLFVVLGHLLQESFECRFAILAAGLSILVGHGFLSQSRRQIG